MAADNNTATENRSGQSGHFGSYYALVKNNTNYRRFWISGLISQAGDWFNYIGIFVLLTRLTGSGQAVSWFLIAKFIPTTLMGPLAGIVADRFSRKAIMISCDLMRVVVVLCYLFVQEREHVWFIYLLAFIQESIWTFSHPARQASLPNLCNREELSVANGLAGASWSVMLAFGAALGGFVSAIFGWKTAIIIDSLSFVVSAALLWPLVLPRTASRKKVGFSLARVTGWHDLVEGIAYVKKHKQVAALLMVKSGWALSGGILVMLTVFGEQVFSTNGQGGLSGVLYSMRGLGAAVGPILAWRLFGDGLLSMRRAIGASFFISSLAYLAFSQSPSIGVAALCVFVGHIGGATQWVFSTTLLHRSVEDRFQGRVFAAEMGLLTLFLSLSTWLTGVALDTSIEPRRIVVALALLFLLPGTCWFGYLKSMGRDKSAL